MSIRLSTSTSSKERKVIQLNGFKGVDFSSSPLDVSTTRAIDMKNFLNDYGSNRKRNGWKQVADFFGMSVCSMCNFVDDNGEEHILVHAGDSLYRLKYDESTDRFEKTIIYGGGESKGSHSQMFVSNNKVYIFNYASAYAWWIYQKLESGEYGITSLEDDDVVYIPKTQINISSDESSISSRSSYESENRATYLVKNTLIGSDKPATYTIGNNWYYSSEDHTTRIDVEIETYDINDSTKTPIIYKYSNIPSNVYTKKGVSMYDYCKTNQHWITNRQNLVDSDGNEITYDPIKLYNISGSSEEVGSIDFIEGKITFNNALPAIIKDSANITITYALPRVIQDDMAKEDAIEGSLFECKFGILYGANGNANRLFVSGNKNHPNMVFYSAIDNYAYFPIENTIKLGSEAYPIKTFILLNDSTLAAFKEHNAQEASAYFITGEYDIDAEDYEITFIPKVTAGNIGEGVIATHASANLSGDSLILSPNGVYGIEIGNNTSTTLRYAKERSKYINEKLKKHSLDSLALARAIVYKNRYYLAIDDVCYVADARYKSQDADDMDDTFNYEWWFLDNIPASCWYVMNDKLYFGTNDGRLCVFDNEYTDRKYQPTNEGNLSINTNENYVVFGNHLSFTEDDYITFKSDDVYALLLDTSQYYVENNKLIVLDENLFYNIHEGTLVYADSVDNTGLSANIGYILCSKDTDDNSFKIMDSENNYVEFSSGFKLCQKLKGTQLRIVDINHSSYTFKLQDKYTDEPIILCAYNNSLPNQPTAEIQTITNVVAEWISPLFDFGTNDASKTIQRLTIATDPSTNGEIEFGFQTKDMNRLFNAEGIRSFSFDDLDFNNFTFASGFASSYTKDILIRNFNYIIFKFKSSNPVDCIINNLTAVYKINSINKGVK